MLKKVFFTSWVVVCTLTAVVWAASAPSDVRVGPLLSTTWGQTTVNGYACFNYYTPDSTGYPPTTAGSTNNYPTGCVATAMAQVVNYHQWAVPQYPYGTTFTIYADGNPYSASIMGGTLSGQYDWTLMQNIAGNLLARQEAGRLLHDLGAALNMQYWSWANWGSATDFANLDSVFNGFRYSNAVTLEGNYVSGGVLTAQSISPTLAELALTTNLDAGLPVIIGINDAVLQSGHALVIDGYGVDTFGTIWFHYNFGLPVQGVTPPATNLGWFTIPGVGTTNDSAGYSVLDGIAMNIFKAPGPGIPTGEIISGRITDTSGNPLSGIQIDITCPANPMFVPVTVYTNPVGIFATYGTIVSNQTYTVTASGTGYATQSGQYFVGITQKQWIDTSPPAGDGYYINTVGNVRADMTLQVGINIPPLPVCDMAEFAGLSAYWQTSHTQVIDPDVRYDYNGDWNVDMQDLMRIFSAWLAIPVEFRTDFIIPLDMPGAMPANMPWQYAGSGGPWPVVNIPFMGAESPVVSDGQSTSFKLPTKLFPGVPGTVDISFQLDCDTEPGADVIEFLVDGVVQTEMSMQTAFSGQLNQMLTYQLTGITSAQLKTLEWRYTKDAANSIGADKVWISNIMIIAQP